MLDYCIIVGSGAGGRTDLVHLLGNVNLGDSALIAVPLSNVPDISERDNFPFELITGFGNYPINPGQIYTIDSYLSSYADVSFLDGNMNISHINESIRRLEKFSKEMEDTPESATWERFKSQGLDNLPSGTNPYSNDLWLDHIMKRCAETYGSKTIGVTLRGLFTADGAKGMLKIAQYGGLTFILNYSGMRTYTRRELESESLEPTFVGGMDPLVKRLNEELAHPSI